MQRAKVQQALVKLERCDVASMLAQGGDFLAELDQFVELWRSKASA